MAIHEDVLSAEELESVILGCRKFRATYCKGISECGQCSVKLNALCEYLNSLGFKIQDDLDDEDLEI
jgi:hypothetical protein